MTTGDTNPARGERLATVGAASIGGDFMPSLVGVLCALLGVVGMVMWRMLEKEPSRSAQDLAGGSGAARRHDARRG